MPDWVEFVPKIETETGVNNMSDMESIGIKTFMLDAEDLWTDVRANSNKFESLKLKVINFCKDGDCKLLILRGVIFS